jgi:hypothetical protein
VKWTRSRPLAWACGLRFNRIRSAFPKRLKSCQSPVFFLHFTQKTFNPWAGLKTYSRSGARDGPCRTGYRVAGIGGRLQRPVGVEYYHVDYVGLRKRFYSADGEMMATSINFKYL